MNLQGFALACNPKNWTIEEYLQVKLASNEKFEYFQGEIFAMSAALQPHRAIASIHAKFRPDLKGKRCLPYGSNRCIHIPSCTLFTYPDVSVVCSDVESLSNYKFNAKNSVVLITV